MSSLSPSLFRSLVLSPSACCLLLVRSIGQVCVCWLFVCVHQLGLRTKQAEKKHKATTTKSDLRDAHTLHPLRHAIPFNKIPINPLRSDDSHLSTHNGCC
uniref:Putative secreted protein n=1 Tax=Anopheles darlingi TaxID=43151 RepID=A0A2M4DMD6_ANODA